MRLRSYLILLVVLLAASAGVVYYVGRVHFHAARRAYDQQDFDRARTELEACLRVWPQSYPAHLLAAQTARRRRAYDEAEQHLAACERLEGETDTARLESVLLQVQRGDVAG